MSVSTLPTLFPRGLGKIGSQPSGSGKIFRTDAGTLSADGFAEMVRPHMDSMVLKARRILRCNDLAWDAVQETLVSLWREKDLPANLRAWLLRTVSNRSLHLRRCCSRCRKHEARAANQRPEGCVCNDPSLLAENCELCAELEKAVDSLPRVNRQVFILREIERLDYEEIARVLKVPVGTIRSRLNRARAGVRAFLVSPPRQQGQRSLAGASC